MDGVGLLLLDTDEDLDLDSLGEKLECGVWEAVVVVDLCGVGEASEVEDTCAVLDKERDGVGVGVVDTGPLLTSSA
jgi:hypothetical protein